MDKGRKGIDILAVPSIPLRLELGAKFPLKFSLGAGRYEFDFEFARSLGPMAQKFAAAVAKCVERHGVDSERRYSRDITVFLEKLVNRKCERYPRHLKNFRPEDWAQISKDITDETKSHPIYSDGTKNLQISTVRTWLKKLQTLGYLPPFKLPSLIENPSTGSKGTFAEAMVDPVERSRIATGIADDPVLKEVWHTLDAVLDLKDPGQVVRKIDGLFEALRRVCERSIRRIWFNFKETIEGIARNTAFDPSEFERQYKAQGRWEGEWKKILSVPENLWKYVDWKYRGVFDSEDDLQITKFISMEAEGLNSLYERFHPTTKTVIPFLTIILLETALNVSSVQRLRLNCLRRTEVAGELIIRSEKWRGKYRVIYTPVSRGSRAALAIDSDQSITAALAIECFKELRVRLPFIEEEEKDFLFVARMQKNAQGLKGSDRSRLISAQTLTHQWKEFLSEDLILSAFSIRMEQIRESIALREYIRSGGNAVMVQSILNHGRIGTTLLYLRDNAAQLERIGLSREVWDFMTIGATPDTHDIRLELGLTAERVSDILTRAKNVGFLGWKIRQHIQEPASEDISENFLDWMLGGEVIHIDDPSVAAEVVAFRKHLLSQSAETRRSTAWQHQWAPLLIYLNIAVNEMPAKTKRAAEQLAEEYGIDYADVG